jgi:RNA polymerase sigma-70 factor (ECF subfamily)
MSDLNEYIEELFSEFTELHAAGEVPEPAEFARRAGAGEPRLRELIATYLTESEPVLPSAGAGRRLAEQFDLHSTEVEELFGEFTELHAAGEVPEPAEFARRAGAGGPLLRELIATYLTEMPLVPITALAARELAESCAPSSVATGVESSKGNVAAEAQGRCVLTQEAVARVKEGDPEGLHYLYVRYADDLLTYVASLVKDQHEAEGITQDIFAKLMTAIKKYEQREVPFDAWILRVARNAALDHLRARRAIPTEEVRLVDIGPAKTGLDRGRALRQALEDLPEDQREVLVLRHIVGLSPVTIADTLDTTESLVRSLHQRARRTLCELAEIRGFGGGNVDRDLREIAGQPPLGWAPARR